MIRELSRLEPYNNPGEKEEGHEVPVASEEPRRMMRSMTRKENTNEEEVESSNISLNLFGSDLALLAKSAIFLEEKPIEKIDPEQSEEGEHILNKLDKYVNNSEMNKKERDKNIQQIVTMLKEKILKNFNEEWNHPDINIRE